MRATILIFSFAAAVVRAQDPEATPSTNAVAPAATVVQTPDEAGVDLFAEETVQLTDTVVAGLVDDEFVAEYADLFAFADTTVSSLPGRTRRRLRRSLRCKTTPADLLWPSKSTWGVFDLLLGGALEKVTPIASVCYESSEYNNYDAAKCAKITNEWNVPSTQ